MIEATFRSELPNPQKPLTKLTKGAVRGAFVSFVSGFLHPEIAKTHALSPSRTAVSLTRQFFDYRQPRGRAPDADPLAMMRARKTPYCANPTLKFPASLGQTTE